LFSCCFTHFVYVFRLSMVADGLLFVTDGFVILTWKTDDVFITHLSTVTSQVGSTVKKR